MSERKATISEQLGPWRVAWVIWKAIPWRYRFFTFPYGYVVYRRIMAQSCDVSDIRLMHINYHNRSTLFRILRPRFRTIARLLSRLESEQDVKISYHAVEQRRQASSAAPRETTVKSVPQSAKTGRHSSTVNTKQP